MIKTKAPDRFPHVPDRSDGRLVVCESIEKLSWPTQCCEFGSCLSAPLKSDKREQNIKGYKPYFPSKSNLWETLCTLQLCSYCLLVSLASVCWRNTSSSCRPVKRQTRSNCWVQDWACPCFTQYFKRVQSCISDKAWKCVCDSLSRVLSCSTSLRRCSNSSLRSFELKLKKKKGMNLYT